MGLGHSPRIVTDGLVLALDAGNPKNYNAVISTNWVDKVGGNDGTLVGGAHHTDGPFVGAGYVFFDGIDSSPYDYVTTSTSSDFTLGTDDFTIEFFFKSNNSTNRNYSTVIAANIDNSNTGFWKLEMNTNSSGTIVWEDRGNTRITATNTNWYDDQWHHLALTREGTSVKLFLDGTQIGSTSTYSYTYAGTSVVFGSRRLGGDVWNGNMSNLRILKGTALYTSNFTPPTKQLTAITNTVLLTCQGNTISDASSGGHTLTASGTAAARLGFPASAFEFDGTNDYVTIPDDDSLTSTTSLTINCWVRATTFNSPWSAIVGKGTADTNEEYAVVFHSSFLYFDVGGGGPYTQPSYTFNTDTWYNICCTHTRTSGSSSLLCYVNGVFLNNSTTSPTNAVNDNSFPVSIGSRYHNSITGPLNGNIAQVSIYNRALSAAEVTQNYNATKGRYGL